MRMPSKNSRLLWFITALLILVAGIAYQRYTEQRRLMESRSRAVEPRGRGTPRRTGQFRKSDH
jgi:hypothetical protein